LELVELGCDPLPPEFTERILSLVGPLTEVQKDVFLKGIAVAIHWFKVVHSNSEGEVTEAEVRDHIFEMRRQGERYLQALETLNGQSLGLLSIVMQSARSLEVRSAASQAPQSAEAVHAMLDQAPFVIGLGQSPELTEALRSAIAGTRCLVKAAQLVESKMPPPRGGHPVEAASIFLSQLIAQLLMDKMEIQPTTKPSEVFARLFRACYFHVLGQPNNPTRNLRHFIDLGIASLKPPS